MRYVSFVNRLELKVPGNVLAQALCLGDVDNDGLNELAVGNVSGSLFIFKGITSRHPLCIAEGLGLITCIGVGDVFSRQQNHLLCVNAEGQLYGFDITDVKRSSSVARIQPVFKQRLPPNTRTLLLANLGEQDPCTLVLGFTDRNVRAYRWADQGRLPTDTTILGKFVQADAWSFDGQVGSLSVTHSSDNQHHLLVVSQPGGCYVTLDCSHWQYRHRASSAVDESHPVSSSVYNLVQSKHYPEAPTEVVGSLQRAGSAEPTDLITIATLNGSITLLANNKVQWQLHVGHQLFSLTKMDITGDGADEVVACAFDGFTYIVNHNRDVVRFQIDDSLCAFTSGSFGVSADKATCSLVYLSLNGKLFVYYDVHLNSMVTSNLLEEMKSRVDELDFLPGDMKEAIAAGDGETVRPVYSWCMDTADEEIQYQLRTLKDQLARLKGNAAVGMSPSGNTGVSDLSALHADVAAASTTCDGSVDDAVDGAAAMIIADDTAGCTNTAMSAVEQSSDGETPVGTAAGTDHH
eukprot:scpid49581/ scgid33366/ Integrin-alpha FG-GAP repeat-containing protein 2